MYAGDAYGNRTRVTAVKGRCLYLLTNAPCIRCVKTTTSNAPLHAGELVPNLVVFVDPPIFYGRQLLLCALCPNWL